MRRWLLALCLLNGDPGSAQSTYPLWHAIHTLPHPHLVLPNVDGEHLFRDPLLGDSAAMPLRRGKEVYAYVQGTGRLYQSVADTVQGSYRFIRIDSTTYAGYNIHAAAFVYKRHIYNLGGYGIWRKNGHLRKFNFNTHEWDLVRLNREIPAEFPSHNNTLMWFDPQHGKVYLFGYTEINDGLIHNKVVDEVWVLDIDKATWTSLGRLTKEFLNLRGIFYSSIAFSPWGLIFGYPRKHIYLIDVAGNQLLRLKDSLVLMPVLHRMYKYRYQFFQDSVMYAFDPVEGRMDSMVISRKDFEPVGIPIYSTVPYEVYYWLLAIVPVGGVAFYLSRRKGNSAGRSAPPPSPPPAADPVSKNQPAHFRLNELELAVLKLLLDNSMQYNTTDINELNRALGLSDKNIGIQKKQRSDVLQSLNFKLENVVSTNQEVIKKLRSELDKRSFEYYIEESLVEKVKGFYQRETRFRDA